MWVDNVKVILLQRYIVTTVQNKLKSIESPNKYIQRVIILFLAFLYSEIKISVFFVYKDTLFYNVVITLFQRYEKNIGIKYPCINIPILYTKMFVITFISSL